MSAVTMVNIVYTCSYENGEIVSNGPRPVWSISYNIVGNFHLNWVTFLEAMQENRQEAQLVLG